MESDKTSGTRRFVLLQDPAPRDGADSLDESYSFRAASHFFPVSASFNNTLPVLMHNSDSTSSSAPQPPPAFSDLQVKDTSEFVSDRPGSQPPVVESQKIGTSQYWKDLQEGSQPSKIREGLSIPRAPHESGSTRPDTRVMHQSTTYPDQDQIISSHSATATYPPYIISPMHDDYSVSPYDLTHDAGAGRSLSGLSRANASSHVHATELKSPFTQSLHDSFVQFPVEPAQHATTRLGYLYASVGLGQLSSHDEHSEGSHYVDKSRSLQYSQTPTNETTSSLSKHRPPNLQFPSNKTSMATNRLFIPGNYNQSQDIHSAVLPRDIPYETGQVHPATGVDPRASGLTYPRYWAPTAQSPVNARDAEPSYARDVPSIHAFSPAIRLAIVDGGYMESGLRRGGVCEGDMNAGTVSNNPSVYNMEGSRVQQSHVRPFHYTTPAVQGTLYQPQTIRNTKNELISPYADAGIELLLLFPNRSRKDYSKKHTRRRLLPRSKSGCWICRIKHLKCDETRPVCSLCLKFNLACDYSPEKPSYVKDPELRQKMLTETSIIQRLKRAHTDATKGTHNVYMNKSRARSPQQSTPDRGPLKPPATPSFSVSQNYETNDNITIHGPADPRLHEAP